MGVQGAAPPAGGSGDVPPQKLKRGELLTPFKPAIEWDSKPWQTLGQRRGQKWGSRGLRPLAGGLGDVPPQKLKRGELLTPLNPPPSGTQSHGKPSANEGGQKWGVQG